MTLRRLGWFIAGAALLAGAASGCSSGDAASAAGPSPSPSPPPVRTITAANGVVSPALTIPGAVAPLQIVALSNALSEPTLSVSVREGDHVTAGQTIAQLDVGDLEANLRAAESTARGNVARTSQAVYAAQVTVAQAPTQVRQAQSQVVQAQQTLNEALRNLDRDSVLVAEGYLPQQNLDEQRIVVRNDRQAEVAAEAQLASTQANLRVNTSSATGLQGATIAQAREDANSGFATAEQLRRQISRGTIVSPVDGIVVNRNLNPGEYPSGRQIFTIEATDTVYAILTASAVQAYEINAGDVVDVSIPGLPSSHFRGRVQTLLDAATPGSTNFTVKVMIPNRTHLLRPGTPIQATVDLRPTRGVVIPSSAFTNDARSRVIAVHNERVENVDVTEVATDGANSVVRGIAAGALIVRDGSTGLSPGQTVKVER